MVEGPKLLAEARSSGARVESVYVEAGSRGGLGDLSDLGVPVHVLAAGVIERIADTVTPQGVLAVVETAGTTLEALRGATLMVVAVEMQDPGNAGALLRAASAAGVSGVVFCDGSVDVYNPKTVRASAGSVFHVPVVVGGDAVTVLGEIGEWGMRRLGAASRAGTDYASLDLRAPTAFVLGNEATGLPAAVEALTDALVTVPMSAATESLNVATAASVLCFEAARQRRMGTQA